MVRLRNGALGGGVGGAEEGRGSDNESSEGTGSEEESREGRGSTSGSDSETISETDLYQVHLLGHACNQKCSCKMGCCYAKDQGFAEGVEQMKTLILMLIHHNESTADLKRFIRLHCSRDCPGPVCRVPHLAAGCAPPSLPHDHLGPDHTPSCSDHIHFPPSDLLKGIDWSVDSKPAFDSTTPPAPPPTEIQATPPRPPVDLQLYATRHIVRQDATPTPNRNMPNPEKRFWGGLDSPRGAASPYLERTAGLDEQHQHRLQGTTHAQRRWMNPWQNGQTDGGSDQGQPPSLRGQRCPPLPPAGLGSTHHQGLPQLPQLIPTVGSPDLQRQLPQGTPGQLVTIGQASKLPHEQGQPCLTRAGQNRSPPKQSRNPADLRVPDNLATWNDQKNVCQASNRGGEGDRRFQFRKYDSQSAARLRQVMQQGHLQLPDVAGGFPEYRAYRDKKPGTVIFSSKAHQAVLTPGLCLQPPDMEHHKLGRGGNGKVSKYYVSNEAFAIKETNYRQGELTAWIKLLHPNLIPLEAVMLGPNNLCSNNLCYQLMPYMSDSLNEVMRRSGCLKVLSEREKPADWRCVDENMWFCILIPVLQGLEHLESLNMQHCDVKASNVLISKSCSCRDILHCACSPECKCRVMLADYDSIKETQHRHIAQNIPQVECSLKTPDQLKKVMGTVGYRAPEKFVRSCSPPARSQEAPPHGNATSCLEGPWCDMWSFGMMITRVCVGRDTDADKKNANILKDQPLRKDLNPTSESTHAMLKLASLYEAAAKDANLLPYADLAKACLQPDFRARLTPTQLLRVMNLRTIQ